jgi:signal peptidase I
VIEDYRIASNSMFPSLKTGQFIFVSKSAFNIKFPFSGYELIQFSTPQRSEIVAFSLPDKNSITYVKRIVAVAGDRVEIKAGDLFINGELAKYQELDSDKSREIATSGASIRLEQLVGGKPYKVQTEKEKLPNYGPVDIPPKHFFALGDNRVESVDSRFWGPVPYSCLKGKVLASF